MPCDGQPVMLARLARRRNSITAASVNRSNTRCDDGRGPFATESIAGRRWARPATSSGSACGYTGRAPHRLPSIQGVVHRHLPLDGQPRFQVWRARARVMFRGADALDNFDPTALYVLSPKNVAPSARSEAIDRARAGEQITKIVAEAIVDRHRGLSETANDLRRACHALRSVKGRLEALGSSGISPLTPRVTELRNCWRDLDAVLSAPQPLAGIASDPIHPLVT